MNDVAAVTEAMAQMARRLTTVPAAIAAASPGKVNAR
jgi:hypothetical protein